MPELDRRVPDFGRADAAGRLAAFARGRDWVRGVASLLERFDVASFLERFDARDPLARFAPEPPEFRVLLACPDERLVLLPVVATRPFLGLGSGVVIPGLNGGYAASRSSSEVDAKYAPPPSALS